MGKMLQHKFLTQPQFEAKRLYCYTNISPTYPQHVEDNHFKMVKYIHEGPTAVQKANGSVP